MVLQLFFRITLPQGFLIDKSSKDSPPCSEKMFPWAILLIKIKVVVVGMCMEDCISGNIPGPFAQYHKHTTLVNVHHNVYLCLYHAHWFTHHLGGLGESFKNDFYSAQGMYFKELFTKRVLVARFFSF